MANQNRLAKAGSLWGPTDLLAYNISIAEQPQDLFFGGPLPPYTGPPDFIRHENRVQGIDTASLSLYKRLDLTRDVMEGEESAVDDFVSELFKALSYETDDTVIRTGKNVRFFTCGELVSAKTDVCVLDDDSKILLLVQEDKSHINLQDPEPQLVAEAIAAFQSNNQKRVNDLFLEPLQEEVFPGVTMSGTFPRFYKIKVTTELDQCVQLGTYPTIQTIVYRHTPRISGRRSDGMRPLENRLLILQCFEAFKRFVFEEQCLPSPQTSPLTVDHRC